MLRRHQTRTTLRNITDMLARGTPERQAAEDLLRELEAIPDGDMLTQEWLTTKGVDTICHVCHGAGRYIYSHGSTWRGGVGTCGSEWDICDHCWGSGDEHVHFEDRRELEEHWREKWRTATLENWMAGAKVTTGDQVMDVICVASQALRALLRRRGKNALGFWQQRMVEYLIARIERLGGMPDGTDDE